MITPVNLPNKLALDVQGMAGLRQQARQDPNRAMRAAAQQFEALFMQMLLKSMRDATPQDGLFSNEQSRLYTSMLDQQFAQTLSAKGMGLAEVMVRQLTQKAAAQPETAQPETAQPETAQPAMVPPTTTQSARVPPETVVPTFANTAEPPETAPVFAPDTVSGEAPVPPSARPIPMTVAPPREKVAGSPREFVNRLWPYAVEASRATGIPPHFMIGQAALESGWGKAEITGRDGARSYNLFGVKAGQGWTGEVAEVVTTEYVNGAPHKRVERFRSYGSYAEVFRDYAALLRNNPRFSAVLGNGGDSAAFARGLQQAGYATDPMYADKLTRILNGTALRQGLVG